MGHLFGEPGFVTVSMHAGITAITELAVKSGRTNRLPLGPAGEVIINV